MDNTPNNKPQNNMNMPDGTNRPRLRKIKRPKQHKGPIQSAPNKPNIPQNNLGVHKDAYSSATLLQDTYNQTNSIVKAENAAVNKSDFSNYTQDLTDNFNDDDSFEYQGNQDYAYPVEDNKKLIFIACICIIIGLILGKFMFSNKTVVRDGLQGVVVNPEVPKGRSRCGIAEKTQGCVLYIMNPQRNELNGRDFYDLAAQLTGRQRFVIETGNMRYSTIKIKPGNIAQLNIPPLQ